MFKYWVILISLVLAGLFCLFEAALFTLFTAASGSIENMHRAQRFCELWFSGFIVTIVFAVSLIFRMVRICRNEKTDETSIVD
jgi:hypothetical protein